MSATPNYCDWITKLLQNRCRENVCIFYQGAGQNKVSLIIGQCAFLGESNDSWKEAKQNASQAAYQKLFYMTENEIRSYCSLPDRPHLNELDHVRDVFRLLRSKANTMGTASTKKRAKGQIGKAYVAIDTLEKNLICLGMTP